MKYDVIITYLNSFSAITSIVTNFTPILLVISNKFVYWFSLWVHFDCRWFATYYMRLWVCCQYQNMVDNLYCLWCFIWNLKCPCASPNVIISTYFLLQSLPTLWGLSLTKCAPSKFRLDFYFEQVYWGIPYQNLMWKPSI